MEVKVLEKDKEKIRLEVNDLTFVNLLHERLWKKKIDYSAYKKDHPYLSKPELLVKSSDTKKSLIDAADQIIEEAEEAKKKFAKALK